MGSEKGLSILEACNRLNVGVFTSVPLFQTRLLNAKIPEYSGITNQVLKLIQIIRSTPNVTAPLLGHKNPAHVKQNIRIAKMSPLNEVEFQKALGILSKSSL